MIVYRFEPNAVFLALNPQEALTALNQKRQNLEHEMIEEAVHLIGIDQIKVKEYARQISDISSQFTNMQLAEQTTKAQVNLENIIEETEKRQIKQAVERKDSSLLTAASFRRLLTADQEQGNLKYSGGASLEERAAGISKDLKAADKLDQIAAEIDRKKRAENYKKDIENGYQQKKAKQREAVKKAAISEAKAEFLQSGTDDTANITGQANGRRKRHKQVNIII